MLAHRRFMPYRPLSESIKHGPTRECFSNSQDLVFQHQELTYVEGYAIPAHVPLAVPHAWAIDTEGAVVDATWQREGGTYFGVALNTEWLMDFLGDRISRGKTSHRAIFEGNHQEGFSLLIEGLPEAAFAEPKMAVPANVRTVIAEAARQQDS